MATLQFMQLMKFFNSNLKLNSLNFIPIVISLILIVTGYGLHQLSEPTIENITSLTHFKNSPPSTFTPGKFIADSQYQSNLNPKEIVDVTFQLKVTQNPFSKIAKIQIIDGPVKFIKGLKVLKSDGKRYLVEVTDSNIVFSLVLKSNELISMDFFPTLENPFNLLSHFLLTAGLLILIFFLFKSSFHRVAILIFLTLLVSNYTTKHYLEFQSDTLGHFDAISMKKLFPSHNECEYCQHLPLGYLPYKAFFKEKSFYQNKDFNSLRFLSGMLFLIGFIFILKTFTLEVSSHDPRLKHLYFLTFLFHPFYLLNNFQISNDSILYLYIFLTIYFLAKEKKLNFFFLLSGTLVKLNYLVLYPFIFLSSSNKKKTIFFMAISLTFLILINVYKDLPAVGVSDVFNPGMQTAKLNHTIKTFFDIPTLNDFKSPFLTSESFNSTWLYLLKSSLFVELSNYRVDRLGYFIGLNLYISVVLFISFNLLILLFSPRNLKNYISPNEVLIASSLMAIVYAVLTVGFESIQNFRHISFVLFPIFIFSSKVISSNFKLRNFTYILLIYFLVSEISWALYFVFTDIYSYF